MADADYAACMTSRAEDDILYPSGGPTSPQTGRKRRILAIDDDDSVRRIVLRVLRQYDLVCASNGKEGLVHIEEGPPFDLILCDVEMPEMSGIELFRHLKANRPLDAERLVFLTASVDEDDPRQGIELVLNRRISKPFLPGELRAHVAKLLSRPTL